MGKASARQESLQGIGHTTGVCEPQRLGRKPQAPRAHQWGEAACPTTVSSTGHPAMRFAPPDSAILKDLPRSPHPTALSNRLGLGNGRMHEPFLLTSREVRQGHVFGRIYTRSPCVRHELSLALCPTYPTIAEEVRREVCLSMR